MTKYNKSKIIGGCVALVILLSMCTAIGKDDNNTNDTDTNTTVSEKVETASDPSKTNNNIETDSTDVGITENTDDFFFILDTKHNDYHVSENCDYAFFPDDENRIDLTVTADDKKEAMLYVESLGYNNCYRCIDEPVSGNFEDYIDEIKDLNTEIETKSTDISVGEDANDYLFVLDTNKNSYHMDTSCSYVNSLKHKDRLDFTVRADDEKAARLFIQSLGYRRCYSCIDEPVFGNFEDYIDKINTETDTETDTTNNTETNSDTVSESKPVSVAPTPQTYVFTINTATNCFHSEDCYPSTQISDENRGTYSVEAYSLQDAIDYMIGQGYSYCGVCAK